MNKTEETLNVSCRTWRPYLLEKTLIKSLFSLCAPLFTPKSLPDPPRLISPTGPVSVGSMVTLTCSCQANPPVDSYVWFMTSGDKLEMIKADTKVYSFEVTKLDRDKLFYCSCGNHLDIQISAGSQLLFEGKHRNCICEESFSIKELTVLSHCRWWTLGENDCNEDCGNHNTCQHTGHLWVVRHFKCIYMSYSINYNVTKIKWEAFLLSNLFPPFSFSWFRSRRPNKPEAER